MRELLENIKSILFEKTEVVDGIRVWINPRSIKELFVRTECDILRAITDGKKIYFWDAFEETHHNMYYKHAINNVWFNKSTERDIKYLNYFYNKKSDKYSGYIYHVGNNKNYPSILKKYDKELDLKKLQDIESKEA